MKQSFSIRPATSNDIPLILSLIKELAEYEKLSHEVIATEEILRNSLFGNPRYAEALLAYWEDKPVGFAIYFHNFSTFVGRQGIYLEDLYVKQEMRGKGIGKKLLTYIAKIAKERNCGRLEWAVLDWNEPAIQFYKSLGAQSMTEWTVNRVSGTDLDALGKMGNEENA